MSESLLLAVVALLAAVVGGVIQGRMSGTAEAKRFRRDTMREAYANFIGALCAPVPAEYDPAHPQMAAKTVVYTEAKARLLLVGSVEVVGALAVYESIPRPHGQPITDDQMDAMAKLLERMRMDINESITAEFGNQAKNILYFSGANR
jgi:hypothetical protein